MKRTPLKAKRGRPRRTSRWQSEAHLDYIRDQPCCICGAPPISEAAHVRIGSGAGMSQKPSDWRAVPMDRACHGRQHSVGERTFWAGLDVEAIIDSYCDVSPASEEIAEVRAWRRLQYG